MDVANLVRRLQEVKQRLNGCESLSVATTDGFVLATTHEEQRQGEFLAAVTSVVVGSATRGLSPFKVGACRALDFRGDRQVIITQLQDLKAYLICVLHPGAHALNIDEPALQAVTTTLPDVLHDREIEKPARFFLQRDERCLIPVRQGMIVGRAEHCDLIVPTPEVDLEHLLFQVLGNTVLVRDLDTRKGSRLNKKRFSGTVEVNPGDRLTLPRSQGFYLMALNEQNELYPSETALSKSARQRRKRAKGKAAAAKPGKR